MNGCKVATKPGMLLKILALIVASFYVVTSSKAQDFVFEGKRNKDFLYFESVKNLVVVPVFLNGKGPFNFILDTGVGPTIVTDIALIDSLGLKSVRKIKINGLGKGKEIDAQITSEIAASIGKATAKNLPAIFIEKDPFNLSAYLGKRIYGLIGHSFFSSFIVGINYSTKKLWFGTNLPKRAFKGEKVMLDFIQMKPYIDIVVENPSLGKKTIKVLVDCGAGHSLSLEKIDEKQWEVPAKNINGNLGVGLSGEITGKIARMESLSIGRYHFKNVTVNFPDFNDITEKLMAVERNGNLGADILRRFDTVYDYKNSVMYLKKNTAFKDVFEHDMSGMEIISDNGAIIVSRIEEDSSAQKAGILPSDQIIGLNFKPIDAFSLNDIVNLLKSTDGSTVIVELYRKNKTIIKLLKLKRRV